jgi:hypothetical protein
MTAYLLGIEAMIGAWCITGRARRKLHMHHSGPIADIAAKGPWVATAGYDIRLILRDAAARKAAA